MVLLVENASYVNFDDIHGDGTGALILMDAVAVNFSTATPRLFSAVNLGLEKGSVLVTPPSVEIDAANTMVQGMLLGLENAFIKRGGGPRLERICHGKF